MFQKYKNDQEFYLFDWYKITNFWKNDINFKDSLVPSLFNNLIKHFNFTCFMIVLTFLMARIF